jgi:hypothetical protein
MATDERERIALDQLHQALQQKERFDDLVASVVSGGMSAEDFLSAREEINAHASLVASLDRTALTDFSRKEQADALVKEVTGGVDAYNQALGRFVDESLLSATLEEEFAPLLEIGQSDLAQTGTDKELARLRRNADWEGDGWAVKEDYAHETRKRLMEELSLSQLSSSGSTGPAKKIGLRKSMEVVPSGPPALGRHCPSCKAEMRPDDAVCTQCGWGVKTRPAPASTSAGGTSGWCKAVAVLVSVALVGWLYYLPYRTLSMIRDAALQGDSETLKDYIDFPLFRESVKENVNSFMARKMAELQKENQDNPYMAVGMALAGSISDRFVESFVTPSAIAALTQGQKPSPDSPSEQTSDSRSSQAPQMNMKYDGLSRFSVTFTDTTTSTVPLVLYLRRQGFSWKITSLKMNFE